MDTYSETVFEIEGNRDHWTVTTGQVAWRNRLEKLAEEYPADVKRMDNNTDNVVVYHVPKSWLKVRPPKKVNLTDEQRAQLAERMRNIKK